MNSLYSLRLIRFLKGMGEVIAGAGVYGYGPPSGWLDASLLDDSCDLRGEGLTFPIVDAVHIPFDGVLTITTYACTTWASCESSTPSRESCLWEFSMLHQWAEHR